MKYDNKNKGVLFKNNNKEKPTQPDYTGTINIDGVEYWLNSWLNESKAGRKYFSLSVNKKEQQEEKTTKENNDFVDNDMDDFIPF